MPDPSQIASSEQPQADKQELAQYEKMKKELRDLLSRKRAIDKNLSYVEDSIFKFEGAYLEDTPNGNIIKGFDNFLKGGSTNTGGHGSSNGVKRKAAFTDNDRLFSLSSATYLKSVQKELFESTEDTAAVSAAHASSGITVSTPKSSSTNKKKKRKKGDGQSSSESDDDGHSSATLPKRLRLQLKDEE